MNTHSLASGMRLLKALRSRLLLVWGLQRVFSKTGPARTRPSSFRHLVAAAASVGLLTLAGNAASAEGDYVFAEGNAAQMAGVKRVIITKPGWRGRALMRR